MTATSSARRRPMRLSLMESLGFIDAPDVTWTTPQAAPSTELPLSDTSQTTGLVAIPAGKHSPHAEPTGELVKDIWNSTELQAPSLVDWVPQTFSSKQLDRRNIRWPMVVLVLFVAVAAAGVGLSVYRQPSTAAAAALSQVRTEAEALSDALSQTSPLVADIDTERLPEANQDATVFFDMGERARAMFAASADLPASDSPDRSAAAEAAGFAIDASRQMMDATAYRTALEPALALPLLETDPNLTDLTTAAQAFTEWRSGFESIRAALPTGVAGQASAALENLSAGLEATQSAYLDALRTGDQSAAFEALGGLRAELQSVRQAMLTDMSAISVSVSGLIEQTEAELNRLIG